MTAGTADCSIDYRRMVRDAALPEPAGTLGNLLADRFTCRAYQGTPVARETIRRILEIAQLTASWCNTQPWEVIITAGETTSRLVAALTTEGPAMLSVPQPDFPFPSEYRGVYLDRKREVGKQLYESVGVARGDRAAASRQAQENLRLFGAPHVAIITVDRGLGHYGAVDSGAYVTNFMLAARAFGIDTTPQAALAGCAPLIRRELDIGEDRVILCGISLGYGVAEHAANSFRAGRARLDAAASFRGFAGEAAA